MAEQVGAGEGRFGQTRDGHRQCLTQPPKAGVTECRDDDGIRFGHMLRHLTPAKEDRHA